MLAGEQVGRCAVAQRLVRTLMVVELEVGIQGREQIGAIGEVAGVDQLVLQTAPQALDKDVVEGATATILLIDTPRLFNGARKSAAVNWAP